MLPKQEDVYGWDGQETACCSQAPVPTGVSGRVGQHGWLARCAKGYQGDDGPRCAAGTIHTAGETGSTLGVVPIIDMVKKLDLQDFMTASKDTPATQCYCFARIFSQNSSSRLRCEG